MMSPSTPSPIKVSSHPPSCPRGTISPFLVGEQLVEALVALAHAFFHAARDERVARLERVDERCASEAGAAVTEIFEDHSLERDAIGLALEREGLHDELRRPNLVERAVEAELVSVAHVHVAVR